MRRSELTDPVGDRRAIVLVDTIGELGALWGLADVAFVGGSMDGRRGGQNMIEPAGFGAAVLFGPHVWNFHDTAARLVDAGAAIQVRDADGLEQAVERLLGNSQERQRLGKAAQELARLHNKGPRNGHSIVWIACCLGPPISRAGQKNRLSVAPIRGNEPVTVRLPGDAVTRLRTASG